MNKAAKTVFILLGLLLFLLLGAGAVNHVSIASLPDEMEGIVRFFRVGSAAESALSPYLFWLALIFMGLILIFILIIAFYPRTYTEIELADDQPGKLNLKKSALESYVRTIVEAEEIMKSPVVSAKLYKNSFKIRVSGKIIPRINITEKLEHLKQEIHTGLDTFFGIQKKINYRIEVSHIDNKRQTAVNRVE